MRKTKTPSFMNKMNFMAPPSNKIGKQQASDLSHKGVNSINHEVSDKDSEEYEYISSSSTMRFFTVVYGKRSTKKHKTWEGDGTLEVDLKSATLKDENGKVIGQINNIKTADLVEGSRICIGSKEVEIIDCQKSNDVQKRSLVEDQDDILASQMSKKRKNSYPSLASPLLQPPAFSKEKSVLHSHFEELILPRPTEEHQWEYNIDCLPITTVSVPGHLCRVLRPHQREGVVFLYKCISGIRNVSYHGAILADEMGLGKTLQCISLIWTLLNSGPYGGKPILKRVLIVVPSSLCQNWNNEFIRWIGSHKIKPFVVDKKNRPKDYLKDSPCSPILILSYEMFMQGFEDIKGIDFDLIACDEGHRLKNCNIKTATALTSLKCKRRIILTGTPIQNDLIEFFSLVNLVNPGILGTQSEFRRKYVDAILDSKQPSVSDEVAKIGAMKSEELIQLTSTFILRRTQAVINKFLPYKNEFVVFCEPTAAQNVIYSSITNYWLEHCEEKVNYGEPSEHLSIIHALKKICNHPALIQTSLQEKAFSDECLSSRLSSILSEAQLSPDLVKDSAKLKIVSEILKSFKSSNERVVLVSNFTQTLNIFENLCKEAGYKYLRYDGSTPAAIRSDIVNRFNSANSNIYVLLLSSKAGGVGLNLVGGSRLILYDSDWNPANDLQAMARIWREGQKKPVYIYRLLTSGTIEEKIFQRQLSKAGLSESIVDPSATSNVKLSLEEMKDLFTYTGLEKCMTHSSLNCDCEGNGKIPVKFTPGTNKNREAELLPDNSSLPSLRMNQLFQWEHHASPISSHVLEDMGLQDVSREINYVFKNKTKP